LKEKTERKEINCKTEEAKKKDEKEKKSK